MTSTAPGGRLPSSIFDNPTIAWRLLLFLALLTITTVMRLPYLGDPDMNLDEGFYLTAADRMWRGELLFVDIWDRKPVGIFILNFLLRPLSSDGIWPVHIAALLSVASTAFLVGAIASRITGRRAAIFPALIYVLCLPLFAGMGAQTPIFYNLLVTGAAWLVIQTNDAVKPRQIICGGASAMVLMGIAIQFKYTAVFEGAFFGMFLLYKLVRLKTAPLQFATIASFWVVIALTPTALAFFYYAIIGHIDTFVYANFLSIFDRASMLSSYRDGLLLYIILAGTPLAALALAGIIKLLVRSSADREDRLFLFSWAIFALVGLVSIGNFYDHYALPVIAPLAILAAPLFEAFLLSYALIFLLIAWVGNFYNPLDYKTKVRSQTAINELTALSRPYLKHGCMFIFDGPSILYAKTNACLLTRFMYPDHLANAVEQNAVGADTATEMKRILALRPAVIVTASRPVIPVRNPITVGLVDAVLKSDYVRVADRLGGRDNRHYILNVRRDLAVRKIPRCEPTYHSSITQPR